MSLSRYEQETVVNFNREDDSAELYTADTTWINKLDKLVEKNSADFKLKNVERCAGKVVAKTYIFPKRFISIRSKDIHPNLSDEQRAAMAERLKKNVGGK